MTDQDTELANRIVALGVGEKDDATEYCYSITRSLWMPVKRFVNDWRVAGALMEKVDSCYPEKLIDGRWQVQASMAAMPIDTEWAVSESLPRAICEACVETLENGLQAVS